MPATNIYAGMKKKGRMLTTVGGKTKEYPDGWREFANLLKTECGWKCERCSHPHDPESGHCLTVHHLTGNKQQSFKDRWAFAVLCQACHLKIQGRVKMDQLFFLDILPVSGWFKPHYEGYLASKRGMITLLDKSKHSELPVELIVAAQDKIDFDPENQVPVCNCCGVELDEKGNGHRLGCLAKLILEEAQ